MVDRIVSGGQTGADRAALDWAIHNNIPHGGWCPSGRKALDGPLDSVYQLRETPGTRYIQRTEWNVRDSDATVIFSLGDTLKGGSRKTAEFADKMDKPWLHINKSNPDPIEALVSFARSVKVLNVAGPRESGEPGIYNFVLEILDQAFCSDSNEWAFGPGRIE